MTGLRALREPPGEGSHRKFRRANSLERPCDESSPPHSPRWRSPSPSRAPRRLPSRVASIGQPVRDLDGTAFGKVAFIGNQDVTQQDFAFIEVDPEDLGRVSAAVKGYPQYPKGSTVPADTLSGDAIQLSGYGLGYDTTPTTQEKRQAVMGFDDDELYDVTGPIHWGDSGGPLVHVRTGKALGIVSRLCAGACSEEGPTVQGILAKAAAAGFPVTLKTV